MGTVIHAIVLVLGFFGILIPAVLLNGLVFHKWWEWFIVPAFNVDMISYVTSLSLAMLVGYLTWQNAKPDLGDEEDGPGKLLAKTFGIAFLRPLFALLFGWILTLFM